jgi:hypothetical protein
MVLSGLQRAEGDGRWLTEQVDKPLPVLSLDLSYLPTSLPLSNRTRVPSGPTSVVREKSVMATSLPSGAIPHNAAGSIENIREQHGPAPAKRDVQRLEGVRREHTQ